MPLNIPEPPGRARDKTRSTLDVVARGRGAGLRKLDAARAEDLELSTPHQVFVMGPDAAQAGAGLDRARPVGWRFLVESGGEVIASAESPELPEGDGAPSFSEGQVVASTAAAVKTALALPQVAKGRFDLRLLQIPAMYLTALWLHSPNADLLMPLEPSPIGDENKVVPPPVFFRKLTEFARGWNPLGAPPRDGGGDQ
jgi:hypothetical protein